jgi:hypothetical protein
MRKHKVAHAYVRACMYVCVCACVCVFMIQNKSMTSLTLNVIWATTLNRYYVVRAII